MRQVVVWGVVCALAAGAGMWPAEAQAQVYTGTINVTSLPSPCTSANGQDFGADWAAVNCAIGLIPASGGELYFPAGRYYLAQPLNITNKNISFRGAGQRTTRLIFNEGNGHGIDFVSNAGTVNHTLSVQSLSVTRAAGAGGNGINAQWPVPAYPEDRGGVSATIVDVHVGPEWPRGWRRGWGLESTGPTASS